MYWVTQAIRYRAALTAIAGMLMAPLIVQAEKPTFNWNYSFNSIGGNPQEIQENTALADQDPRIFVARLIYVFLGLLGMIAVILIIWAGFKWMTAAGDKSQIQSAKKIMTAGVIGLLIIFSAFALTRFIISSAIDVTGADENP